MGLSGRKEKQRIPADPRNLTWADDAAKFGSNYLSKLGWDSSKGLGVDGDGRKSHIKVSHKLDMLGIGAAQQKGPNGIAWKQNKDFENLLKRLNESRTEEGVDTLVEDDVEVTGEGSYTVKGERKRKRKRDKGQEEAPEEKAERKRKKKNNEDTASAVASEMPIETSPAADTPLIPQKPYVSRHRAHRARVIASKSIASKSAAAIAEILGIAPTPSALATPSGSATPQGKLTPLDDSLTIEKITTSTKSVADYFKDKLLAKSSKSSMDNPISTPESRIAEEHDFYDAPRRGLGSSHPRHDRTTETLDTETRRMGIPKFSSLISSSPLAATVSITTSPDSPEGPKLAPHVEPSEDDIVPAEQSSGVYQKEKKKKKKRTKGSATDAVDMGEKVAKEERKRARAEKRALKEKKMP